MYALCVLFFFFKQKTAYDMRISDWSSDVCSSDLQRAAHVVGAVAAPAFKRDVEPEVRAERHLAQRGEGAAVGAVVVGQQQAGLACVADQFEQIGRASCRARVCQYV